MQTLGKLGQRLRWIGFRAEDDKDLRRQTTVREQSDRRSGRQRNVVIVGREEDMPRGASKRTGIPLSADIVSSPRRARG